MSDKSYVTMEQHQCPVCGEVFDTGAVLLDRRMRDRFEPATTTGLGLCPEHKAMYEKGYIALVEVENKPTDANLKLSAATRTGNIAHVRLTAFPKIFNIPIPTDKEGKPLPMAFVEKGTIDSLQALQN
jgi:hypothetical protein